MNKKLYFKVHTRKEKYKKNLTKKKKWNKKYQTELKKIYSLYIFSFLGVQSPHVFLLNTKFYLIGKLTCFLSTGKNIHLKVLNINVA